MDFSINILILIVGLINTFISWKVYSTSKKVERLEVRELCDMEKTEEVNGN